MPSTTIGRVSIVPKGAFNYSTIYNRLDAVSYNNESWLVLQDNTQNIYPSESQYFMKLGGRGGPGRNGTNGTNGIDGITPDISIGTVDTLSPGSYATVTRRGTDANPIFDFGIPRGDQGPGGGYTLPKASSRLGGVKAMDKSTEDQPIVIDESGYLYTKHSATVDEVIAALPKWTWGAY